MDFERVSGNVEKCYILVYVSTSPVAVPIQN